MKVLVADDDAISRRVLEASLARWGWEVVTATDGLAALRVMSAPDAPALALLDWMMPGLEGPEVCRHLREHCEGAAAYLILVTAKGRTEDVVAGLDAGADDFLTKPFVREELRARVAVGRRVVTLQRSLAARVTELERAVASVKQLNGMLPICVYCKKIREDQDYWRNVEDYVRAHSAADFTHGICPDCMVVALK